MKIVITGSSGYLGKLISKELTENGHKVSGIKRHVLYGDIEILKQKISGAEIIINLAGAPIFQRWTKRNKQIIFESRATTTQNLIAAINKLPAEQYPKKFISASAIGIYKSGYLHDETSIKFDEGFVGYVVKNWEKPLINLPENIQKIVFRIGLVLGKNSITIKKMKFPFKLGLGAVIGNGKQPFPFIHEKDAAHAFLWAVNSFQGNEIFNLTAPEQINNKVFTKTYAKILHRPAILCIPGFVLKMIFGKASALLTESPGVKSEKIRANGFVFSYSTLESALNEIIKKRKRLP
jgi:uncharacterized protein